jgi:hypothetical protein
MRRGILGYCTEHACAEQPRPEHGLHPDLVITTSTASMLQFAKPSGYFGRDVFTARCAQRCDSEWGPIMRAAPECDGRIAYDLQEFCKDYGHPAGRLFTLEVTHDAVTYIYADVPGAVRGNEVIFDLHGEDLVDTRKAH